MSSPAFDPPGDRGALRNQTCVNMRFCHIRGN